MFFKKGGGDKIMGNGYFEKIKHGIITRGGIAIIFLGPLFIFFWAVFIVIADRINLITATTIYFLTNYIALPIMVIWLFISVGWLIFLIAVHLIIQLKRTPKL